jgi:NAD(P)H dehydrogenase (quinone)
MATIAVTGVTGKLGGRIARRLEAAGVPQRLLVRDLGRAPRLANAEAVVADYSDAAAAISALAGVRTLLMVSAAENPHRVAQHRTFVQAAAEAGVEHLVYISFFGAAPTATFTLARDHWDTEQHIKASGMAYTFLRDNVYADLFRYLAGDDGVLRGPAGQGRVAGVAQDDIADVAAVVLQSPHDHSGATYDLTGPQALTLGEVADILTRVTGRAVTYALETVEEAYASRLAFSDSQWQLDAWVSTYTAIAAGELDGVTSHVADLTGHQATSLEDLLRH